MQIFTVHSPPFVIVAVGSRNPSAIAIRPFPGHITLLALSILSDRPTSDKMSVDSSRRGSVLGPNSPRNRNADSPGPTKDKSKSFYRQAFAEVNIMVSEGFLNLHLNLPVAVKNLLAPRPCLPTDMKNLVSPLKRAILTSVVSWRYPCRMLLR